jgi:hypothetical protein
VNGAHTYLLPVLPERGPDGRGRALTWEWPDSAIEITPEQARDEDIDVVIVQRPSELNFLVENWTGRKPGADIPCIYLEHNTPPGPGDGATHPASCRSDLTVVHVTHFNRLFWDCGKTPTAVIEHGIVDPGYRYTGELDRAAAVINDPVDRGRITGTDLVTGFREQVAIDLFGMRTEKVGGTDLSQAELHRELPKRRVYFHPYRWTSLGLSLLEAMHLGMPVVAACVTEAAEVIPRDAGVVTNDMEALVSAIKRLVADPDEARSRGELARQAALSRFGLKRFLEDWDQLLEQVSAR